VIGIAIEASTVCESCGQPLPINAMEMSILCPHCSAPNELNLDDWETIVGDAIKAAPTYAEDEGNRSTVIGRRKYSLMYGRQLPRFDSKVKVDMAAALEDPDGKIFDPETGAVYYIRPAPAPFKEAFPGLQHLVCEDADQWSTRPKGHAAVQSGAGVQPQAINCPKCNASFETIGEQREVFCGYCGAACFIPDEVWQRLHPVKAARRWFLWYDEKQAPLAWRSVGDVAVDAGGNLYMIAELESMGDTCVLSMDRQRRLRWLRSDLNLGRSVSFGDGPFLALSRDDARQQPAAPAPGAPYRGAGTPADPGAGGGRLYVWSPDKNSLRVLSCRDGADLDKLGGIDGRQPQGGAFSLKGYHSLACDIDGTLLAYSDHRKDEAGNSYFSLVRYDRDGNIVPTWPEASKPGFFGRLARSLSGASGTPRFSDLGDRPEKCDDREVVISVGLDGSCYLQHYGSSVAKYDREGNKVYNIRLPDKVSAQRQICGDAQGRAVLISHSRIREVDGGRIHRISADGAQVSVLVKSVLEGGPMGREDQLALAPDGTIYVLAYREKFRVFSAEGEVLEISDASRADDKEKLQEAEAELD